MNKKIVSTRSHHKAIFSSLALKASTIKILWLVFVVFVFLFTDGNEVGSGRKPIYGRERQWFIGACHP